MHDGCAALYRRVDRPTSNMDGEEMELRLSRRQEARCLIYPPAGRAAGRCRFSIRAEGNTPGQFSHLNGFYDPQGRHVDDRDVVGDTIGDQQIFLVRRKGTVPNSLADQQVFQDGVSDAIDHRYPVGRPQIDEAELAISGDIDADRLDRFGDPGYRTSRFA
jgi:hypothetical protein